MVGKRPVVRIQMEGQDVECLLDTGSQVTLMSESCFFRLFGKRDIGPAKDIPWLQLRAANGLDIPYVGYATLKVQVGEIVLPGCGVVVTRGGRQRVRDVPVLGMNIIGACWGELFHKSPNGSSHFVSYQDKAVWQAWEEAFAECQRVEVAAKPFRQCGVVGRRLQQVPPESEVILWARVPVGLRGPEQQLLVEPCAGQDSVGVARTLGVVRRGRIPVSEEPSTISRLCA